MYMYYKHTCTYNQNAISLFMLCLHRFWNEPVEIITLAFTMNMQCIAMWGEVNWCCTPFFNHIWLYSFHNWRNTLFLGVNQQSSVSKWQLPLMGFEPEAQRRGASSFKWRRIHNWATEDPYILFIYSCMCVCVCVCVLLSTIFQS